MPNFNFGTSILPTSDNTFSLGSSTKRWKINDQEITFDTIYPIGSIYISINNVNPGTLFGGTWEQIEDKFLLSAGSTYTAGNTGGSASNSHTHTMAHTHTMSHTHSQVATTSGGPSTANTGANNNATAGPNTANTGGNNNATAGPSNNTSGSTSITTAQIPSHMHEIAAEGRGGGAAAAYNAAHVQLGSSDYWGFSSFTMPGAVSGTGITYTRNTGSGSGHTHTLSSHTHTMSSHTHTLSSHTHTMSSHTHTLSSHTHSTSATTTGGASNATTSAASNATTSDASNTNNMPPYLVVYMWKRTA